MTDRKDALHQSTTIMFMFCSVINNQVGQSIWLSGSVSASGQADWGFESLSVPES